jgi:hypothetical protein
VDPTALEAFSRWALADARRARARGVRGSSAYITIDEPRLRASGLERAYLLRETEHDVIIRCDWDDGRRGALRLPRDPAARPAWARPAGGLLLAAYLAGAYRDSVVSLERTPFLEDLSPPPPATRANHVSETTRCLRPVAYLPSERGGRRSSRTVASHDLPPVPHAVAWYIRRLQPGYRASTTARSAAEAVGMLVPPGYTFVNSHVWPRAADPRSAAAELRATAALAALRAILQSTARATASPGQSLGRALSTAPGV